jgi:DNA repair protein RadA/Sms
VVALLLEGSRPLLVEVQALVGGGGYGPPRRAATGVELDRLALLTAVLAKRAGVGIGSHDVYVSLAGGLRSREPALDLPLALALASSVRDRPVLAGTVAGAEVALSGELRPVPQVERRLREAARLGYRRALVAGSGERDVDGLHVIAVPTLRAALDVALDRSPGPKVVDPGDPEAMPARLAAVPIEPGRRP